jgi:hypothetical protein
MQVGVAEQPADVRPGEEKGGDAGPGYRRDTYGDRSQIEIVVEKRPIESWRVGDRVVVGEQKAECGHLHYCAIPL